MQLYKLAGRHPIICSSLETAFLLDAVLAHPEGDYRELIGTTIPHPLFPAAPALSVEPRESLPGDVLLGKKCDCPNQCDWTEKLTEYLVSQGVMTTVEDE